MGLSTKHVSSGDQQGFDWPSWGKDPLQQQGAPEPPKPPPPEPLNCPRCSSSNTKFCYYNNYNKSQPRHFCKSCKRHWTKGGSLRNVPVGGGRKNKRPRVSNSAAAPKSSSAAAAPNRPNFPANANNKNTGNNNNNNNNMSNILYQALIGSPDIINNNGGDTSAGQDRNTEFDHHFSSLGTFFDMNNNNNPMSYQSLIAYDNLNHYPGNLDSIEENVTGSSGNNVAWPGPETGSSLDLPNYWSWSEIDVLASSSDHLNLSWDGGDQNDIDDHDLEIKLP